jgi:hypothetical protein
MATHTDSWFPLFEFQDWIYQSFLVLPTSEENEAEALPDTPVTAKKWAKATLQCGQAFSVPDGYKLDGTLSMRPGIEFSLAAKGALGVGNNPAPFEATVTATEGPLKGAIYQLVGWVFPEVPISTGAARILSVKGSVRAVRGTDANPGVEPGGQPIEPIGTAGLFIIVSKGPA